MRNILSFYFSSVMGISNLQEHFLRLTLTKQLIRHPISKHNEGFTLIELFVVIVIIGILFSVAVPSFLNQANKARQSEAKTYIGSMNRAQQAYFLESNSFANMFSVLGLGIDNITESYEYGITVATGSAVGEGTTGYAKPSGTSASVKAYIGGVKIGSVQGTSEATTLSVLCEAILPLSSGGADGTQEAFDLDASIVGAPKCPTTAGSEYRAIQ